MVLPVLRRETRVDLTVIFLSQPCMYPTTAAALDLNHFLVFPWTAFLVWTTAYYYRTVVAS
jgi:hypothetical protein